MIPSSSLTIKTLLNLVRTIRSTLYLIYRLKFRILLKSHYQTIWRSYADKYLLETIVNLLRRNNNLYHNEHVTMLFFNLSSTKTLITPTDKMRKKADTISVCRAIKQPCTLPNMLIIVRASGR